jgi:hypothetical protein
MKFHFLIRKTEHLETKHVFTAPVGNKIVGLLQQQQRPQTVELDYDELRFLLKNPDYLQSVCMALAIPQRNFDLKQNIN